ncbi:CGNR zinc finger domain-containing protein [Actinomycetospora flava]|uniref:ABATE domain-containing protein n=1 Tax=Actinomycetospora flava TaxID=3129232 RepID=A0ABU8MCJ1_9PSEU
MIDEEFPRPGGRWCLDFVATLGRRHRTEPLERLPDAAAFGRWLDGAGLPVPATVDDDGMARVRELREALNRLVRAHMDGGQLGPTDLVIVNGSAAEADLGPRLDASGVSHRDANESTVAAVTSTVARDAIDLIATAPADRVRECEHPDCSLLFLDHTQGNRRRWCSMQRCGNQVKVADYRQRRRGALRSD